MGKKKKLKKSTKDRGNIEGEVVGYIDRCCAATIGVEGEESISLDYRISDISPREGVDVNRETEGIGDSWTVGDRHHYKSEEFKTLMDSTHSTVLVDNMSEYLLTYHVAATLGTHKFTDRTALKYRGYGQYDAYVEGCEGELEPFEPCGNSRQLIRLLDEFGISVMPVDDNKWLAYKTFDVYIQGISCVENYKYPKFSSKGSTLEVYMEMDSITIDENFSLAAMKAMVKSQYGKSVQIPYKLHIFDRYHSNKRG